MQKGGRRCLRVKRKKMRQDWNEFTVFMCIYISYIVKLNICILELGINCEKERQRCVTQWNFADERFLLWLMCIINLYNMSKFVVKVACGCMKNISGQCSSVYKTVRRTNPVFYYCSSFWTKLEMQSKLQNDQRWQTLPNLGRVKTIHCV